MGSLFFQVDLIVFDFLKLAFQMMPFAFEFKGFTLFPKLLLKAIGSLLVTRFPYGL